MKNNFKFYKNKLSLFLSTLFLLQLVLFNTNNIVFAATTPSVSYTVTGETKVGNTIEIAVNVSNISDLYAGSIDFVYDTNLLEIQSITKGNIFGSNEVLTPIGNNGKIENGKASFAITMKGNKDGVNSDNDTLAIIKAKILKEGTINLNTTSSKTEALNLTGSTIRVKLANSNANNIDYEFKNITIDVSGITQLTSFIASKNSPQVSGSSITFTATSNSGSDTLYKFYVFDGSSWKTVQDYSSKNTFTWTPSNPGSYKIRCRVKLGASGSDASYMDIPFTISKPTSALLTSFVASKNSPQVSGSSITFTATSNSGSDTLYKFYVFDGSSWKTVQDYSSKNTFTWTPSNPGSYKIRCRVKLGASGSDASYMDIPFTISKPTSALLTSFVASKNSPQVSGSSITFTATSNSGSDTLYKFYVFDGSSWKTVQDYSSKNTFTWSPSNPGSYKIRCRVKLGASGSDASYMDIPFTISKPTSALLTSFVASKNSPQVSGSSITFTATSNSGSDTLYKFYVFDGSSWKTVQDYSSKNTFTWSPSNPGSYKIRCRVKLGASGSDASYMDIPFTISKPTSALLTSFVASKNSPQVSGSSITFTATSNSGSDTLYKFYVFDGSSWKTVQDYSSKNTFTWSPSNPGSYKIRCRVKLGASGSDASYMDIPFTISKPTSALLTSFVASKNSPQVSGSSITFTATSNSGSDTLYKFYVFDGSSWKTVQDYSSKNTFTWSPSNPGSYKIRCRVKLGASGSDASYMDIPFTISKPTSALLTSFVASKNSPQVSGSSITFTATSNSGSDTLYKFYVFDGSSWKTVQDYSSKNTFTWSPSNPGSYKIRCRVKLGASGSDASYMDIPFTISKPTSALLTSFVASKNSPQVSGSSITFTATSNSGSDTLYKFYVFDGSSWKTVQDYSSKNTFTWSPSNPGSYKIRCRVKLGASGSDASYMDIPFTISKPTSALLTSFVASKNSPQVSGSSITFTATSNSGSDTLYKFYVFDGSSWKTVQDYSSKNTFTWTPSNPGSYKIRCRVKLGASGSDASYMDSPFTINTN